MWKMSSASNGEEVVVRSFDVASLQEVCIDNFLAQLMKKADALARVDYGYEVRPIEFEQLRSIILDLIAELRRRGIDDLEIDEAEDEINKMPAIKSGYIPTGEERYRITMALYHLANVVKRHF